MHAQRARETCTFSQKSLGFLHLFLILRDVTDPLSGLRLCLVETQKRMSCLSDGGQADTHTTTTETHICRKCTRGKITFFDSLSDIKGCYGRKKLADIPPGGAESEKKNVIWKKKLNFFMNANLKHFFSV